MAAHPVVLRAVPGLVWGCWSSEDSVTHKFTGILDRKYFWSRSFDLFGVEGELPATLAK